MTIGELFVKLGFKVEGAGDFKQVASDLKESAATAGRLAVGVDLMVGAFTGFLGMAMNAGNELYNFHLATGLSTDSLQQWENRAVKAGSSLESVMEIVKGLQEILPKLVMSGDSSASQVWNLLHFNPGDNAFVMLDKLQAVIQKADDKQLALIRTLAARLGINDKNFAMLRRPKGPDLEKPFVNTPEDIKTLADMKAATAGATLEAEKSGDRFATVFKPGVDIAMGAVHAMSLELAKMTTYLNSNSESAHKWKETLNVAALSVFGIGTLLTTYATSAKLLSGLFGIGTPGIGRVAKLAGGAAIPIAGFAGMVELNKWMIKTRKKNQEDNAKGIGHFNSEGFVSMKDLHSIARAGENFLKSEMSEIKAWMFRPLWGPGSNSGGGTTNITIEARNYPADQGKQLITDMDAALRHDHLITFFDRSATGF